MVLGRLHKSKLRSHNEQLTYLSYPWWRIYTVAAGTPNCGGLVWLPAWQSASDNRLTQWIYDGNFLSDWLEKLLESWLGRSPCCRYCLWKEQLDQFASGSVLVILCSGRCQSSWSQNPARTTKRERNQVLGGFILASIALFFGITYGLALI